MFKYLQHIPINNRPIINRKLIIGRTLSLQCQYFSFKNDKNFIKKLPKKTQAYFNMPTYPLKFPLTHPQYIIEDRMYYEAVQRKFKTNKFTYIEGIVRQILFAEKGDLKKIFRKVKKKLKR